MFLSLFDRKSLKSAVKSHESHEQDVSWTDLVSCLEMYCAAAEMLSLNHKCI